MLSGPFPPTLSPSLFPPLFPFRPYSLSKPPLPSSPPRYKRDLLAEKIAIAATSYMECQAQNAQNAEKVSKRSSGPVGPECQKSAEKVQKVTKKSLFGTFS